MARANAANATTHAETVWRSQGAAGSGENRRYSKASSLRHIVFLCCGVGFLMVAAIVVALTDRSRDQALANATSDLEIIVKAVWRDLQDAIPDKSNPSPNDALSEAVAGAALTGGRRLLVTDEKGRVTAATPPLQASGVPLADILGQEQALAEFADKAGAMRVTLADGTPAIAAVRKLRQPFGQMAIIQPVEEALAPAQSIATRYAMLFATTTTVLLLLLAGYCRQTSRLHAAHSVNARMRHRLETALSRGRCGLWDWDIARGRVYWSDSMYELLGMEAQGRCLSSSEIDARLDPRDGGLKAIAERVAASKTKSLDHEFRIKNANGDWIWLRARLELAEDGYDARKHLVGIAVDVSEQKALAEHSATANLRLRDAIETISEAFVLWNAQNHLVTCNSKFLDLHGLTTETATPGATYASIMTRATAPLVQTETASADRPGAAARTYEARLVDGRWLQINERRTKDGGYVSVGADITTFKRNEEKLLDSERRLMATVADLTKSRQTLEITAQQLATLAEKYHHQKAEAEAAYRAKSEFLANMSHELRTPLNHIIGFAEAMQAQYFGALGSPKYIEYCEDILKSGLDLKEVIADVLDMSELEAGRVRVEAREIDIAQAARKSIDNARARAAAEGVELIADIDDDLRSRGDRDAIVKVLGILLSNSVKFTRAGGRIRLRARRIGGSIDVFVEDSGRGIDRNAIARLGRPFEQPSAIMRDGMKGSGLGLAIARSLIELHHGAMRIRSRVGVGTIVLVRLPAAPAARLERVGAPRARASEEHAAARLAGRQPLARSGRAAAPAERIAGNETTTRNPGALSSMRNAP
jgi:two-component system cell cycle sensor histidine kinase PleC